MNLHLNEAIIAKITIKKVMSQLDHVETLLTYGVPRAEQKEGQLAPEIKMVLADWFTEMRVHLRRVEYMAEQAVQS